MRKLQPCGREHPDILSLCGGGVRVSDAHRAGFEQKPKRTLHLMRRNLSSAPHRTGVIERRHTLRERLILLLAFKTLKCLLPKKTDEFSNKFICLAHEASHDFAPRICPTRLVPRSRQVLHQCVHLLFHCVQEESEALLHILLTLVGEATLEQRETRPELREATFLLCALVLCGRH